MRPAASGALCCLLALGPGSAAAETQRLAAAERVEVNLVLIDVVVRDRRERPIVGLTPEDFELLVDSRLVEPEDLGSVEEICAEQDRQPSASAVPGHAAPPSAPTESFASAVSVPPRHMVIYFDFSQLRPSSRRHALLAARDFLKKGLDENDRVMLLTYKNRLAVIQGFTSSKALLLERIDALLADRGTVDVESLREKDQITDLLPEPDEEFEPPRTAFGENPRDFG
ncbi:MAG: hypothetical protein ACE5IK_15035, partial [Acidobacteriota bacterium]